MKLHHRITRLGIVAVLFGSLTACAVVPVPPHAYHRAPVVVETYPVYRHDHPYRSYGYDHYDRRGHRGYDDRDGRYYRDGGRRYDSPLDSAARTHRDIRRSLGLPRLPGMP
ncbi:MAG: hypothetical protein F9K30_15705 [Dechloromonas sp.]|nr:MAG: hypothetical protein F9K30_15705 [Dechloromonas sp.]